MVFQRKTDTFENICRIILLCHKKNIIQGGDETSMTEETEIANDSKSATWKCPCRYLMLISNLHFHRLSSLNSLLCVLIFSGGLVAPTIG